ncbi:alpha/beta fold hydrolase [Aliikangiella coralliicola]|uniref:Alpha/beta hydrolase n=1 Tax=Aliikangiella coralliicola TaxID=2592383 RepID=A0A545TV35_9GAMM|nr:alpha/beta hydrolase [Aliikangiella coralliicola]TQV81083.1 alpha/beta hydrolase [Aliikangiella coralliicola]
MQEKKIQSHDGFELNYAVSESQPGKPWIALIIPFGLKLSMAKHFFDFFGPGYNVITWETRSILDSEDRGVTENEFDIENHILDLRTILTECPVKKFIMVGYCSGAGLALAAANRFPQLIDDLILVHGEYTMLNDAACTTQFAMEIDSLLSLAASDEEHLKLVFEKIKSQRFEESANRPDGIDLPFTELAYLRRYAANYLAYKDVNFEKLARFVAHKTLLISGERDVQANATSTEKIHELMPNSEVYIDPEADHYGILREDSSVMVTIWNYLCVEKSNAA